MSRLLSKLFSLGWWSSEFALLMWLYGYLLEAGPLGAAIDLLFYSVVLWLGFTALMLLKRRAEKHAWPRAAVRLLRALHVPGYIYDCWFNTRYGTLLFLEFPPVRVTHVKGVKLRHRFEPLTRRLQRHYPRAGWRGNIARLYCWLAHLADKGHCL